MLTGREQVSDDAADGHHVLRSKFCDLVVKCLIKLTKALSASLQEVDLDMLLLSIHQFFMGLGAYNKDATCLYLFRVFVYRKKETLLFYVVGSKSKQR